MSWVSFDDDDARRDASEIVVEAVVEGRVGERAMFGAQASVWDVEVTAVRKGDVEVGDRLEVASTPVTCSGATYPDGDPLDTDDPLVLFLTDSDFGIAATEPGLALITPLDGVSSASGASGDAATWALSDPADLSAASTRVDIGVTRLGCASGVTGEVLEPVVTYEAEKVVIEVDVAPLGAGVETCPGNDVVPVRIELDEPIGDRHLVDGACLAGEAVGTVACEEAVRWP